jgi:hypothetical protein
MVESPSVTAIAMIQAVRLELSRFLHEQRDAAVQLHCIAVDLNLIAALDGRDDPSFREILASNVGHLADAVRNANLGIPVVSDVES